MQRRAYGPVAVLAAALLAGTAGCSGSSGDDGADDSKHGGPATSTQAAEPGKYRSLPEPCGAVGDGTLRALLPGVQQLEESEREEAYAGQPAITYDTDRRVGCRWASESPEGTRHLDIDFERVVSYDPALSDEDRAQELYDQQAAAADIPAPEEEQPEEERPGSGEPSASASESRAEDAGKAGGGEAADGSEAESGTEPKGGSGTGSTDGAEGAGRADHAKPEKTGGSPSPEATADPDTAPRPLDELGDVAYIDDQLVTADSGVHRDITIVFRTSNVLVTIAYDQWSTRPSDIPGSEDLQSRAQRLALELSGRFDE